MAEFTYQPLFTYGEDRTEYRLLSKDYVSVEKFGDKEFLVVQPEGLTFLAKNAMHDVSFYLRPSHQEQA